MDTGFSNGMLLRTPRHGDMDATWRLESRHESVGFLICCASKLQVWFVRSGWMSVERDGTYTVAFTEDCISICKLANQ